MSGIPGQIPGKYKVVFCERLGNSWRKLAMYLEIPPDDQARFERGDEARAIWVWLQDRDQLGKLQKALNDIERPDLAALLRNDPSGG